MPPRKLVYEVDVNTSDAVSDLRRLGTEGARAGKDIADGFQDAESSSSKALKALSTSLDKVESDAKGLAQAVDAIKAHLTVDVDDAKVAGFASDLKNRMGVAFDDVTADAKQFADVLERGVNMDRTTSELRNVGDELDTVRNNSDQSRSVLANMAGNTAQDLGELGGVVGGLGVGLGQLAEYATEGNIGLKDLGKVAGPLAALSAASFVIQGISSGLADLKKRQEAYTQQQEDFNDALRETGSVQETVNQMLEDNVQLASAPELNWWQGMMDDLPVLTGLVDETATAQSGLIEAMAHAGISADAWTFSLDHGLGAFNAMEDALADARDQHLITADEYDLLRKQHDLYSQALLKAEVQQMNLNKVFGDGTNAANAYDKAMPTPERLAEMADETKALADAAEEAALAIRAQGDNARDAYQIMQQSDWGAAAFDAAETAMGAYFETADEGLHSVGDLSAAYEGLHEALHDAFGEGNLDNMNRLIPDMTTPEGRAVLDALDNVGRALIPSISRAFANSHGDINKFRADMTGLYQSTLVGLSNQLGISEDAVAALLAQIGFTPDHFDTMYELNGIEDAKLKLQLLQTQINNLPEYVQLEVQQQIITGDYNGALATVQNAFSRGAKVPLYADDSNLYKSLANFQQHANNHPIVQPVVARTSGKAYMTTPTGRSAEPSAMLTADGTEATTYTGGDSTVSTLVMPARAVNVNVNVNAAVIGNRADVQRAVLDAMTQAQRLGRIPA
jgi:tetratricopeptide (TPR) repeat protein